MANQLTDRQKEFTIRYISNGFNAYDAALGAGYTQSYSQFNSHKLTQNPLIMPIVHKAFKEIEIEHFNKIKLTLAQKVDKLKAIIEDIIPSDGSEPKRKYYKDALSAIDLLNRMSGDYAPARTVSVQLSETKEKLKDVRKAYEEY